MGDKKTIRIGLIGIGFVGRMHADAIAKAEGITLAAIVEKNPEIGKKAAEEYGCSYYSDAREMLSHESIDMIDICLPTFLHEEHVALGAEYGKHVLCEKPFGLSADACLRMTQACEDAGVKLMVAQSCRWVPEFMEMKKLIDSGALGPLHMVYLNRLAQHPDWRPWNRDPQKSGGGLFDLHLHDIDYLYHVFGPVETVYAVGWKSPSGCWNHMVSTLTFKDGHQAVAEAALEMTGPYPFSITFRITGDRGTAEHRFTAGFNIDEPDLIESVTTLYEVGHEPRIVTCAPADQFQAEIMAFVHSIENDGPVPIPPRESVEVIRVIEAIQESLETGGIIAVG